MSDREAPSLTIVTGAGGWLGTALLHALSGRGAPDVPGLPARPSIRALVGAAAEVDRIAHLPNVEIHVGDLCDERVRGQLFAGADGADVLHTAGVIHPASVAGFAFNRGGTMAVLEAARRAECRRVVHVSSNSPFGCNADPSQPFGVDEPFNPYYGYGRSKMEAELAVRDAVANGLDAVIVRPPWFYGPYQPARQTQFLSLVRKGRFPLVAGGRAVRSVVYVGNLVDAVVRAELRAEPGTAYWAADAVAHPFADIVEAVRDAFVAEGFEVGRPCPRVPGLVADAAEAADKALQSRGRYNQQVHVLGEMNKHIVCDISRTTEDLGYRPAVELLDGMRRTIRWCTAEGIAL